MDTPEKSQISTASLSKFEDSPVFNYINSLSPIKPVKSIHIPQTFHSLSFASVPSVFTSPHVSSHKESRFLRRHNQVDPLKPEFSSENENKVGSNEGVVEVAQLFNNSAELQENFDPAVSTPEASTEPPSEHLKFAIELPRMLRYDCGSPDCDPTPRCGTVDSVSELADTSASLVPFVKEATENSLPEDEVPVEELQQDKNGKENTDIEWESLMSDAADLLIFNPLMDTDAFKGLIQKSLDPAAAFCTSLSEMHRIQIVHPVGSGEKPVNQTEDNISAIGDPNKCITHNPGNKMESEVEKPNPFACKVVSSLHRGMRRRCLDFEMVGARRKNLDVVINSSSSLVVQTDEKVASKDEQSVPHKPANDSSRCIMAGIGLHLNALGIASSDSKNVKHEISSSGVSLATSAASFKSGPTGQELNELLTLPSTERDMDPAENDGLLSEDVSPVPGQLVNEEFNQSSPKKKRRRMEGEGEACKRCNCKKSKCLKLYCECFAAGVYCIEPCACVDCFNKPIHEDTVLATRKQIESRNPLAFAPKVIRSAESVPEIGDEPSKTPASARHKRGCNCKKSNCLKKYCECYQGGVGCSFNCRCEGCKNAFGRKDGSTLMETDAEAENETETCEKSVVDNVSQKSEIHNNEEQNLDGALPTTPLRLCRPFVQLPFSSKSKPPRTFFGIGSSSGLYTGQRYGKPNFLQPESRFENQFQTFPDNDIPEILRADYCSSTGIKSSSPNSKRISPPQNELGSHSQRGGRKLILQSIPSFPSLTPKH